MGKVEDLQNRVKNLERSLESTQQGEIEMRRQRDVIYRDREVAKETIKRLENIITSLKKGSQEILLAFNQL